MKIARVLHLTENESKDRAGREIGDDWLIASFGCDSAGNDVHVTTDTIRASEYMDVEHLCGPLEAAQLLVDVINACWHEERQQGLPLAGADVRRSIAQLIHEYAKARVTEQR